LAQLDPPVLSDPTAPEDHLLALSVQSVQSDLYFLLNRLVQSGL
jgi:hypothetical protein